MGFVMGHNQSVIGADMEMFLEDDDPSDRRPIQTIDEAEDSHSKEEVVQKEPARSTASYSKSEDGSLSIDDIVIPDHHSASGSMTDGLTVMEKLKLAAKLDSSRDNLLLRELLETSITDLETSKKKQSSRKHKRKHQSRSDEGRTPSSRCSSECVFAVVATYQATIGKPVDSNLEQPLPKSPLQNYNI
jgi:predicted RND superfamily exporter protein